MTTTNRSVFGAKTCIPTFADVYQNSARYCVIFVSKHYSRKLWTNHERKAAQSRAFVENREYLLPVRFDQTRLPGLLDTTGYIDATKASASDLAALITRKVGRPRRRNYLPPVPDHLFRILKSKKQRDYVVWQGSSLVDAFKRMTEHEKRLVTLVFTHGCPAELPSNIHISADLLQRIAEIPLSKIIRDLRGIGSVGFSTEVATDKTDHAGGPVVMLKFEVRSWNYGGPDDATGTVNAMIDSAFEYYCGGCAEKAVLMADFSHLSSSTAKPERHGGSGSPKTT